MRLLCSLALMSCDSQKTPKIPRRFQFKFAHHSPTSLVIALEPTMGNDKNRGIYTAAHDVWLRSMSVHPFAAFAEVIAVCCREGSPIAAFVEGSFVVRSQSLSVRQEVHHPFVARSSRIAICTSPVHQDSLSVCHRSPRTIRHVSGRRRIARSKVRSVIHSRLRFLIIQDVIRDDFLNGSKHVDCFV